MIKTGINNIVCGMILNIAFLMISCGQGNEQQFVHPNQLKKGSYGYDRSFLQKQLDIVELTNGNAKVLLVPQYQGRVMTSTCTGDSGLSFGWINYKLIQSGEVKEHMNAYGGEERIWLGPEGGQFGVFFRERVPYTFDHWFTPKELDTAAFDISSRSSGSVRFSKRFQLVNRAGTQFTVGMDRKVRILNEQEVAERLKGFSKEVKVVAFESQNTLTNRGDNEWKQDAGLLSIWMLGMMKPSAATVIIVPVKAGSDVQLGPVVNDQYFGSIPADRLKKTSTAVFLKADGKHRGKVGVSPQRVQEFIGSYDSANHILSLLQTQVPDPQSKFVNSAWEDQHDPYSGDAINAYNDGPLTDGSQMGPFYELEASSPAAKLAPGASLTHTQVTYHISGDEKALNAIASKTLGLSIEQIKNAFR